MLKLLLIQFFISLTLLSFGQRENKSDSDKGTFQVRFGVPWINVLKLNPYENTKNSKFGFIGFSAGLEYSYTNKTFIEFSASSILTANYPYPTPSQRHAGIHKNQYTHYFNISNGHKIDRFTVSYGLSLSKNTYQESYNYNESTGDTIQDYYWFQLDNYSIGLMFRSYYELNRGFIIGLNYRPDLFRYKEGFRFEYEYLISLELSYKLKLNNR